MTTQTKDGQWLNTNISQFLIGKVLLTSDVAQIIKGVNPLTSQFLIGKVLREVCNRTGIVEDKSQFLIGKVLQQHFRCF